MDFFNEELRCAACVTGLKPRIVVDVLMLAHRLKMKCLKKVMAHYKLAYFIFSSFQAIFAQMKYSQHLYDGYINELLSNGGELLTEYVRSSESDFEDAQRM